MIKFLGCILCVSKLYVYLRVIIVYIRWNCVCGLSKLFVV